MASLYPNSKEAEPLQTQFVFFNNSCLSVETPIFDKDGGREAFVVELKEETKNPKWLRNAIRS